jgi:hypothetical protein
MGRGVRDGESEPGVDDLGAERQTVRHLRAWCSDTYLARAVERIDEDLAAAC